MPVLTPVLNLVGSRVVVERCHEGVVVRVIDRNVDQNGAWNFLTLPDQLAELSRLL